MVAKVVPAEATVDNPMPVSDSNIVWLKRIFQAMKPLGQVSGGGSNRLSVDVNNIASLTSLSNITNVGGVAAFDLMKTMSRQAYNGGIRSKLV